MSKAEIECKKILLTQDKVLRSRFVPETNNFLGLSFERGLVYQTKRWVWSLATTCGREVFTLLSYRAAL